MIIFNQTADIFSVVDAAIIIHYEHTAGARIRVSKRHLFSSLSINETNRKLSVNRTTCSWRNLINRSVLTGPSTMVICDNPHRGWWPEWLSSLFLGQIASEQCSECHCLSAHISSISYVHPALLHRQIRAYLGRGLLRLCGSYIMPLIARSVQRHGSCLKRMWDQQDWGYEFETSPNCRYRLRTL